MERVTSFTRNWAKVKIVIFSLHSNKHGIILQVDVLEAQFSQLVEEIQSTHDFESIKHAHESFVTTLQSQLFFTMPAVSQTLLYISAQH